MKSLALLCIAAACAWAGLKPEAYRLASLPAAAEPGQKLVLCAANIGTGAVDVSLEFINVSTGSVVGQKTVSLAPLGSRAAGQPCLTTPVPGADSQSMVGVAMVRKSLLSFREAQVTASIQVLAPDASGAMRTIETIPLSRTTHPSDGAPVYTPDAAAGGHHK